MQHFILKFLKPEKKWKNVGILSLNSQIFLFALFTFPFFFFLLNHLKPFANVLTSFLNTLTFKLYTTL